MIIHVINFLKPSQAYLNPGTGSIIIQLISAALGGGLFFLIRSQWKHWFKKKSKDGSEPEVDPDQAKATFAIHGALPKKCPNCKKPISATGIEWIDDESAKCPHCGEVIETKKAEG